MADRCHQPVVVGVDGSRAALNAVRWATAEAVNLDVPLRIVHVTPIGEQASCRDAVLERAEDAAIQTMESVRLDSVLAVGNPGDVLVGESPHAQMMCVGARARQFAQSPLFGPTASALAERARCPVAIIRSRGDGTASIDGVVAVVLSDEADNDDVIHLAMHEGRLRRATVRQIDRRTDSWVRRYPDVDVETVAAGTGHAGLDGKRPAAGVGLAVVGGADANRITGLRVPNCHPIAGYPDCSVLLLRS
ncbi:universal stress protein [Mycolicibacterium stellerae]|uniref:universal stress protein n=1 Tax=Mycolicibacterium stellerae TaxID=2358193 RepID=UPI000F0B11EF|nr:universal stress protein [Mycolicibacterium stellerae]